MWKEFDCSIHRDQDDDNKSCIQVSLDNTKALIKIYNPPIVLEELCVDLCRELVCLIFAFYLSPAGASQRHPVLRSYSHNTYKIQCHFSWGCWSVAFHRESQRCGLHDCWLVYRDFLGLTPDKTNSPPPQDKPTPGRSESHCRFLSPLSLLSSSWYQRDKTILPPVCLWWKTQKMWVNFRRDAWLADFTFRETRI